MYERRFLIAIHILTTASVVAEAQRRDIKTIVKKSLSILMAMTWGLSALASDARQAAVPELVAGFIQPPANARPWVFWFWMHGHVTQTGLTADLEAMKAAGLGGAVVFQVRLMEPAGPVAFNSPAFFAVYEHAAKEAARLGLQLSVHPLEGWNALGGPWITPAQSMKKLVWTEYQTTGPGHVATVLKKPEALRGFYKDISVIAFPVREEYPAASAFVRVRLSATKAAPQALLDHDERTAVHFPAGKGWIEFEFPEERAVCSAVLVPSFGKGQQGGPVRGEVRVRRDGGWETVAAFAARMDGKRSHALVDSLTLAFKPARTKAVRIEFHAQKSFSLATAEVLEQERVHDWEVKAGMVRRTLQTGCPAICEATTAIPKERVLDLTSQMKPDGSFAWDAPEGHWCILRLGFTTTENENGPASDAGRGLEADKMSRAAVPHHFDSFGRKLISGLQAVAPGAVASLHTDSWEAGLQTWTEDFVKEFKERRGYDPTAYLPVLAGGVVIGSQEESERFLWDVRRTWADLIKVNFFETLRDLSHASGLLYQSEATGTQMMMSDPLNYNSVLDLPVGEFWAAGSTGIHPDCKIAATVANTYNKPFAGAEAFTSMIGKWEDDPYSLKALGDRAFCTGINRFMVHRYAHQPWLKLEPGMNFGPYGINYERTVTWWEPAAAAWNDYLARCQFLLQQGHTVADVAVLIPDDVPTALGSRDELWNPIPRGVDYDGVNLEILGRLTVAADGALALPHGPRYRVLLLPEQRAMRPETLRLIASLVEHGATVVGPRPVRSPSLQGYPACDSEIRKGAEKCWGGDRPAIKEATPLQQLLTPDFAFEAASADAEFNYIHRRTAEADIYFVANSTYRPETALFRFRVTGKAPELWNPLNGTITQPNKWRQQNGFTEIPLEFSSADSVFVLFRKPTGLTQSEAPAVDEAALPPPREISGGWTVRFPRDKGAPAQVSLAKLESWTMSQDEGVKYFSGTATYEKAFTLPPGTLAPGCDWQLDLGEVQNIAEVTLNGRRLGVLWKPPFRISAASELREGENRLEVKVTNLWANRLIGDAKFFPETCKYLGNGGIEALPEWLAKGEAIPGGRTTFATWKLYQATDPLRVSGLLGPVRLLSTRCVRLPPSS